MISYVPCPAKVASVFTELDQVAMISFTGSPDVGWGIRQAAPKKKVALELGNNALVIIEPDADIEKVAASTAISGYSFQGQSCISIQRIYGGAELIIGGNEENGVLTPSILEATSDDIKVCANEVFGPVVSIMGYSDFEDTLTRANNTKYGLQAGVFTNNISKALKAANNLDFGGVCINESPTYRADNMPYGGIRDSGNTKEGPAYSILEMTTERLIIINEG